MIVIVKYDGYSEEEAEEVEINDLCKRPIVIMSSSSDKTDGFLFKPLKGNEDAIRIREKYDSWDVDEDLQVSKSRRKTRTKLSEMAIVIDGETWKNCKRGEDDQKQQKKNTSNLKKSPAAAVSFERNKNKEPLAGPSKIQLSFSKNCGQEDETRSSTAAEKILEFPLSKVGTSGFDGFDEIDLEKPRFNFKAVGEKLPYVLSKPEAGCLYQVPASINQHLRDYQREGILFLFKHYQKNQGAILGDDMGLGKTVQVIGFMAAILGKTGTKQDVWRMKPAFIRESDYPSVVAWKIGIPETRAIKYIKTPAHLVYSISQEKELLSITTGLSNGDNMSSFPDDPSIEHLPFLVIGPGCVLYNWLDELDTWGHFSVGKFHSSDKQQCLKDLDRQKLEVVVTTFETFRDNKEDLNNINWAAVIVDEAHRIKGLKAQTTQALRSIACKRRYGLTGTALQNNMMELWSILDWARPGYLGSATDFQEEYVLAIEQGQKHNATKRQLANARKCKQKFSEIRRKIMIRRTKNLISDQLPQKDDNVVFCKLTDFQLSVYQTILQDQDLKDAINAGDPCVCGSGKNQGKCCCKKSSTGKPLKSVMFQFMHLLLKVANHVALLAPDKKASSAQNQAAMEICKKVFEKHPCFLRLTQKAAFSALSDPKYCCKMKVLVELLTVFHQNHSKVLLFSYSTRLLDILETYMLNTLYQYRRIDGKTSSRQRMNIVREFNKDPNIFICLVSTKAGGLGLNMTGANVVIIFDPNWNPSHDLQAQDRAYRIGQQRHVQVFRLITAGSIEENIYLRQVYKQQLDQIAVNTANAKRYFLGIQGDKEQKGELFGLKNMFKLTTGDDVCLSRDILERNEQIEKHLAGHQVTKYVPSSLEESQENDDDNECPSDSDDQENSDESNKESDEDDEDEDPYAEWFSSIRDEVEISLGTSDEDDNDGESGKKDERESKHNNSARKKFSPESKRSSRIPTQKERDIDDIGTTTTTTTTTTPQQSVPSFTNVFKRCGVVHVHENRKVTGGSRAEDHMTKCALQEVLQENKNSQQLAIDCDPYQLSDTEEHGKNRRKRKAKPLVDHNTPKTIALNNYQVFYGQTPEAMLRNHLTKMATSLGFTSIHTLCEKVISVSATERLQMLQQFYISEHGPWLKALFETIPKPMAEKAMATHTDKATTSKRRKVGWKITPRKSKISFNFDSETELQIGKSRKISQQQTRIRMNQSVKTKSSPGTPRKKPSKINFSLQEFHPSKASHVDNDSQNKELENTTNIDALLDEMALTASSKNVSQKNVPNLNSSNKGQTKIFSEVDRIFLGPASKTREVRKPPPKKKAKPTEPSNKSKSPDSSSRQGQDAAEKVSNISDSVNFLDELLKNSTLKESADDNSLWKKSSSRSKPHRFSDHVSRVLEEDEKEYKSMFASGKMVRVGKSPVMEDQNEEEGTPSLF